MENIKFTLTQPQLQVLVDTLLQFPAKDVLRAIDILRNLPNQESPLPEVPKAE